MPKKKTEKLDFITAFGLDESKTNDHYYRQETITGEPITTEITMNIKDIKTIGAEELDQEKTREQYDELLTKIYWFIKGQLKEAPSEPLCELLEEIEKFKK